MAGSGQASVEADTAVNVVCVSTELFSCCLSALQCLCLVLLLSRSVAVCYHVLCVALTRRAAISRTKDRHASDRHVAKVGQGVVERSCDR